MEARKIKPVGGLYGEEISVTATKEEWLEVLDKLKWIPDSALRDDGFSNLVHWLINQGVYE
jgi:hypothetical protein